MAKDEIVKTGPSAIVVPSFIDQGDHRGTETITSEDLQMPRLSLAQALSPELDESNPRFIEGLKVGDAFNSLTGKVYGKKPIEVVIVRVDKPRFIEFDPVNRGSILDFNVSANDPRTLFTTNAKGETEKPLATRFMEYVAIVLPDLEPIALSFKGSGIKTAKMLNGLIRLTNLPAFAVRYVFSPSVLKDAKSGGSYAVFSVKYAKKADPSDRYPFVDETTYEFAASFYESIKDKNLAVDTSEDEADEPLAKDTLF